MTSDTALLGDPTEAIGRTETRAERIAPDRVAAMAATLDMASAPAPGAALPAGWHWLFFNPFLRRSDLGADGHPKLGDFLPDTGLPRRMWAGGRIRYHAPLPVGAEAEKHSEIIDVTAKSGRSGRLVFVTLRHRISADGVLCIDEEQDIVYRDAPAPGTPAPTPPAAPDGAAFCEGVSTDPTLLFRYSALTSNGHRIHYDHLHATAAEGYAGLVVHGPLTATLLQGLATRAWPDRPLRSFSFRGMSPLIVGQPFTLNAAPAETDGGETGLSLWAAGPNGALSMQASAGFGAAGAAT